MIDYRQTTYHHDSHSDPATIDQILRQRFGVSSQPPRVYVNDNGTLVVDGGSPVVVVPENSHQAPHATGLNQHSIFQEKDSITSGQKVQAPDSQVLSDPSPSSPVHTSKGEIDSQLFQYNQQVAASKSIFKLFKALQTFTQTVLSNEKAKSVQLVTQLDGSRSVLLLNATRNDFLNLLLSLSKFNLVTLK